MKKTLSALLWLMLALSMQAANTKTLPASDKGVTYIGRIAVNADQSVSYDWVGTYLETDFTGGWIAADISEAGTSYHNVFIDGQLKEKICITGSEKQRIVLAQNLSKGTHRLRLQKCTEGENGCTTIHAIAVKPNGTLSPVARPERMIEVYGDSYTCGYGTESEKASDHFLLETENCNKAYGCIIARYFGADYALVAHSGQGMVRDYGDKEQLSKVNMSTRYTQVFDAHGTQPYSFSAYTPQLVIINLGTNDFSPTAIPTDEQYVGAYQRMIQHIKEMYKGVKILCVTPHSANRYLTACIDLLAKRVYGDPDVFMANPLTDIVTEARDMGADWHPNYQGQKKIAMCLIPQISAIMGWNLTDKPVE